MSQSLKPGSLDGASPRAKPAFPLWISTSTGQTLATLVIVSVAVWIVYGPSIEAPLVFDDEVTVANNSSITRLWPLVGDASAPGPLNPPTDLPTSGRPLANLSLAINYRLGGLNPIGYHIVNTLLHILSAVMLGALVQRTLELDCFQGQFKNVAWPLSLAIALVWALHPLVTEAVVYITQRTELLVGFFYLSTLYCSLRYWTAAPQRARSSWLVLAALCCLSGMASKEVMVSAPLAVLLFERTFLSGSFSQAIKRSWPLYAGLSLGWVLLLALNYDTPRGDSAGFHHGVLAHHWWFTQAQVLLMYLKLAVWPWPLVIHYGTPYITTVADGLPWVVPALLLAIGTLVLVWRSAPAGFPAAVAWMILAPTLVVPIITEVAAERRMYLPLAALVTLVVVGGYRLLQRAAGGLSITRWPIAAAAGAGALIVVLGVVSAARLSAYANELTLWQDAAIHQPDDPVVQNGLGTALLLRGDAAEALPYLESSVQRQPHDSTAQLNLATALMHANRPQEAVEHARIALKINPDSSIIHNVLGTALSQGGQLQEAVQHLEESLRLNPDAGETHLNLAVALLRMGQPHQALAHFERGRQLRPDLAQHAESIFGSLRQAGPASDPLTPPALPPRD